MSDSEFVMVDVAGRSAAAAPATAVREALGELAKGLAAAGAAPYQMTAMAWIAPDPAAFDPALHQIDLAYREVLGGFRPPITVTQSSDGAFAVAARAQVDRAVSSEAVWHGFSPADLARQYSPRGQVADMGALFARWRAAGAAFRSGRGDLDIAYGPTAFETLDIYRPDNAATVPLWVFIHGGYWQASDKEQHAQFAAGMLDAGFAVANVNYGLCPDVPLSGIVAQIRAALWFLAGHAEKYGFAADSIHVAGHSAGAHLAAMAAADPAAPALRSALLLSGLFDLTPLSLLPPGRLLGVTTPDAIAALSPMVHRPRPGTRIALAVGGRESDEFKWQSAELAKAWGAGPPLVIEGANHFDLLDGLIEGALLDCARQTAR